MKKRFFKGAMLLTACLMMSGCADKASSSVDNTADATEATNATETMETNETTESSKPADDTDKEDIDDSTVSDIVRKNEYGQVTFMSGKITDKKVTNKDEALGVFVELCSELGVSDPAKGFSYLNENQTDDMVSYRFTQEYQGYTVYGKTMSLCADAEDGEVFLLNNSCVSDEALSKLNTEPVFSADDLMEKYEGYLTSEQGLEIYALEEYEASPILVYSMLGEDDILVVSAETGEEIRREEFAQNALFDALKGGYDATFVSGSESDNNIYVYNSSDAIYDAACKMVYDNLADTKKFYWDNFSRDSIDNHGMPIRAYVHYTPGVDNASWVGLTQSILYYETSDPSKANPLWVAKDVTAHEFTHGVMLYCNTKDNYEDNYKIISEKIKEGHTNNLLINAYMTILTNANKTCGDGAVNEGFADVMAFFVDNCDDTFAEDIYKGVSNPPRLYDRDYSLAPYYNEETYYSAKQSNSPYPGVPQGDFAHSYCIFLDHAAWQMNRNGLSQKKNMDLWYAAMIIGYDKDASTQGVMDNIISIAKERCDKGKLTEEDLAIIINVLISEGFEVDRDINEDSGFVQIIVAGKEIGEESFNFDLTFTKIDEGESSVIKTSLRYPMIENDDQMSLPEVFTLPVGKYELTVKANGYITSKDKYKVKVNKYSSDGGSMTEVFVEFTKDYKDNVGGQTFHVIDAETGKGLDGVTVKYAKGYDNFNNMKELTISTFKDSKAGYFYLQLPVGFYSLTLEKEGYETKEINEYFHQTGNNELTYSLTKKGSNVEETTPEEGSSGDIEEGSATPEEIEASITEGLELLGSYNGDLNFIYELMMFDNYHTILDGFLPGDFPKVIFFVSNYMQLWEEYGAFNVIFANAEKVGDKYVAKGLLYAVGPNNVYTYDPDAVFSIYFTDAEKQEVRYDVVLGDGRTFGKTYLMFPPKSGEEETTPEETKPIETTPEEIQPAPTDRWHTNMTVEKDSDYSRDLLNEINGLGTYEGKRLSFTYSLMDWGYDYLDVDISKMEISDGNSTYTAFAGETSIVRPFKKPKFEIGLCYEHREFRYSEIYDAAGNVYETDGRVDVYYSDTSYVITWTDSALGKHSFIYDDYDNVSLDPEVYGAPLTSCRLVGDTVSMEISYLNNFYYIECGIDDAAFGLPIPVLLFNSDDTDMLEGIAYTIYYTNVDMLGDGLHTGTIYVDLLGKKGWWTDSEFGTHYMDMVYFTGVFYDEEFYGF